MSLSCEQVWLSEFGNLAATPLISRATATDLRGATGRDGEHGADPDLCRT